MRASNGERPPAEPEGEPGAPACRQAADGRTGVPAPLPGRLAPFAGFVLNRAALRAREGVEAALDPLGIKPRHYGVLATLAETGPLTQQGLGERLRIDRTTMVAVVDDLEAQGLAHRQPDPADRRAYRIAMTLAGQALLRQADRIVAAVDADLLAPLSPDERALLHRLLWRICRWSEPPDATADESTTIHRARYAQ